MAFAAYELPNVRDTCPLVRQAGETASHNTLDPSVAALRCVFSDQAKDDDIKARAKALARGEVYDAVVLNESPALLQRAKEQAKAELPPSECCKLYTIFFGRRY